MPPIPSMHSLRYAARVGNDATSPEQAREALKTMGDILGGADKKKCRRWAQEIEVRDVMKICGDTVKSVEQKAGIAKPWWKFW